MGAASVGITQNILPPTLKTRSCPHWTVSVAWGSFMQNSRMDSWFIVSSANPLRADALIGSPCLLPHTQGLRPGLRLRSAETAELRYLRFAQEQKRRRTSLPSPRSGTDASPYFEF